MAEMSVQEDSCHPKVLVLEVLDLNAVKLLGG